MELLQTKRLHTPSSLVENTLVIALEDYQANIQAQPLTPLMEEIIMFQLEELALFPHFELSNSSLN